MSDQVNNFGTYWSVIFFTLSPFGWCTGLRAYAQLKWALTMPCVKPYTILYWKGEGSTNL